MHATQNLVKAYTDSDTKSGHSLQRNFCSECVRTDRSSIPPNHGWRSRQC